MSDWTLQALLATWVLAALALSLLYRSLRVPTIGLVFAYLVNLAVLHWMAALVHSLPWYTSPHAGQVHRGFEQATYGVLALTAGTMVWLLLAPRSAGFGRSASTVPAGVTRVTQLSRSYVWIGLTSYLFLIPSLGQVPTVGALLSAAWNLFAVGVALGCREASDRRRWAALAAWLTLAFLTPALTIVTQGFLGYGAQVLILVMVFLTATIRHRWRWGLVSAALIYPALSFYVGYMSQRDYLRQSVWGGDPLSARVHRLYQTARNTEAFDLTNLTHLQRIDTRLNQNQLVGACVDYLGSGNHPYAAGETIWYGVIALVPRILWPAKPVVAGSMGLVGEYTGLRFAPGTSVGIGQVMEFYMNFGTGGVILGFFCLGLVLAAFDQGAAVPLFRGDVARFASRFLPGMALLQAGGSLVEVTSSAAAGAATAYLVNRHLLPMLGVHSFATEKPRASVRYLQPPLRSRGVLGVRQKPRVVR